MSVQTSASCVSRPLRGKMFGFGIVHSLLLSFFGNLSRSGEFLFGRSYEKNWVAASCWLKERFRTSQLGLLIPKRHCEPLFCSGQFRCQLKQSPEHLCERQWRQTVTT